MRALVTVAAVVVLLSLAPSLVVAAGRRATLEDVLRRNLEWFQRWIPTGSPP